MCVCELVLNNHHAVFLKYLRHNKSILFVGPESLYKTSKRNIDIDNSVKPTNERENKRGKNDKLTKSSATINTMWGLERLEHNELCERAPTNNKTTIVHLNISLIILACSGNSFNWISYSALLLLFFNTQSFDKFKINSCIFLLIKIIRRFHLEKFSSLSGTKSRRSLEFMKY